MALLPIHRYFVYNNEIFDNSFFNPSENEGGIYEVLRVVDGVPLFLEEHLARFFDSAKIENKRIQFSSGQIEKLLNLLVQKNKVSTGNILLSCKSNLKAFFITHNYPTDKMYKNGVACGVLKAERENPNAKVFQTSVRDFANKMIQENGFYEVILVDHLKHITEGSRSNIFFVKDNKLITPPGNEVLLGITRKKTIELAQKLNIEINEGYVSIGKMSEFSAAFITGTSPKILPVRQIGNFVFNTNNSVVTQLMNVYDLLIQDYVKHKIQ